MVSLVRALSLVSVAMACTGAPAAQGTTWIVDRNNGPGTNFLDLPPALAAAQTFDRIIVRGGNYTGGTIDKGIWVLAEPGASPTVVPPAAGQPGIRVTGIAADLHVVVAGLLPYPVVFPLFGVPAPTSFLELTNCPGRVHINQSAIDMTYARPEFAASPPAISITDCGHVTIHEVTVVGMTTMGGATTNVAISDSSFVGHPHIRPGPGGCLYAETAILKGSGASLTLSRTNVYGGGAATFFCGTSSQPAITAYGGRITVAGSAQTVISAGVYPNGSRAPAIGYIGFGAGTIVEVDPRVSLVSANGAPLVASQHQLTRPSIPFVSANDVAPGGTVDVDLVATQGDIAEIYLSLSSGPIPGFWPNSGEAWIQFGALGVLGRFTIPASDQVSVSVPIPNAAFLQGFPLTFQALTVSLQNGFRFSTPATPVLN